MGAYFALAAAMIFTGANVALGKIIVAEMSPASFAMLRFVCASVILLPFALMETGARQSLAKLNAKQWLEIVLLSLFGVVGFTTLMLIGIQYTSAINAGIISSSLPAMIALLSLVVLREYITGRKALSIGLAVLGIALINIAKADSTASVQGDWTWTLIGNAFILAAIFSEAVFAILTRRYSGQIPPWTLTTIVHALAIPLTLPILLWQDGGWILPVANLGFWLLAIYYIVTASVLSFYLWCLGIRSVPAATAGLFTAFVPVTSLIVAVLALGEQLVMLQILGLMAVLASLAIGLGRPSSKA